METESIQKMKQAILNEYQEFENFMIWGKTTGQIMRDKNLSHWIFNYDNLNNVWKAAKRENYKELFNNHNSEHVLKSSKIDTLIDLISMTDGDPAKINELVKTRNV